MSGRRCSACNGPAMDGSGYCSQSCRAKLTRFAGVCDKAGLYSKMQDILKASVEMKDMIARMDDEVHARAKRLTEAGRISDAQNELAEWRSDLVRLTGKYHGYYKIACAQQDEYLDLKQRYGIYVEDEDDEETARFHTGHLGRV